MFWKWFFNGYVFFQCVNLWFGVFVSYNIGNVGIIFFWDQIRGIKRCFLILKGFVIYIQVLIQFIIFVIWCFKGDNIIVILFFFVSVKSYIFLRYDIFGVGGLFCY